MTLGDELHMLLVHILFMGAYLLPLQLGLLCVGWLLKLIPSWFVGACAVPIVIDFLLPVPAFPHFSRRWYEFSAVHKGMTTYLPSKLCSEFQPERTKSYLVCASPHGVWQFGYFHFAHDMLSNFGVTPIFTGASVLRYLPLLRRNFFAWGFTDCSKPALVQALALKYPFNVTHLTTGGIAEMFYGTRGVEQIILSRRKGMCKIALQTGAHLVPCYYMGLNQSLNRVGGKGSALYNLSRKLQISLVAWYDRFYIPYGGFPRQHPMLVAVGPAIPVQQVVEPSRQEIDELHEKFCRAMRELFNKHKGDPIFKTKECPDGWKYKELYFEDEEPRRSEKES